MRDVTKPCPCERILELRRGQHACASLDSPPAFLECCPRPGRLAQRESVPFTRERSQVQSLQRPPAFAASRLRLASHSALRSSKGWAGGQMKYVYLLQSIEFPDETYVGLTDDLRSRFSAHNGDARPWSGASQALQISTMTSSGKLLTVRTACRSSSR